MPQQEIKNSSEEKPEVKSVERKQRKPRWLLWLNIFLFLLGFLVASYFILDFIGSRGVAIRDESLQLNKVEIPKEENGYFTLKEAVEEKFNERLASDSDWVSPHHSFFEEDKFYVEHTEDYVKENREALKLFEKLLEKPRFQVDIYSDPLLAAEVGDTKETIIDYTAWRSLARLKSMQAVLSAYEGSFEKGISQALSVVKVGERIVNSQGSIMQVLVGVAIRKNGLITLQSLVEEFDLGKDELKLISNELDKLDGLRSGYKKGFKWEYNSFTQVLDQLVQEQLEEVPRWLAILTGNEYVYSSKRTKARFARVYKIILDEIDTGSCGSAYPEEKELPLLSLSAGKINFVMSMLKPNPTGRLIVSTAIVSHGSSLDHVCSQEARFSILKTLIGLKRYYSKNSTLPKSLDELVPDFLTQVPADPFSKKALGYNAEKGVVYSSGYDEYSAEDLKVDFNSEEEYDFEVITYSDTRDKERVNDLEAIKKDLEDYHDSRGQYPISKELIKVEGSLREKLNSADGVYVISGIAKDPLVEKGWYYGYKSDDDGFTLTVRLEDLDSEKCNPKIKEEEDVCIYEIKNS